MSDPNQGNVVVDSPVKVTCLAIAPTGAEPVLGSSVKIRMLGADGKQIGDDGTVMSTSNANEYSASFVLTAAPSGVLSFTCTASDRLGSHTSTTVAKTFYDRGPTIALAEPSDKSAHSLGEVLFKFSALPTDLASGDQGSAVEAVTLNVNGVAIKDVLETAGMKGTYQKSIDLNNPQLFSPAPVGLVPVIITATNKRGQVASNNYSFIVDSAGPVIKILAPQTGNVQFVGGQVTLEFTVTDEVGGSQVDPQKVTVQLNTSEPVPFQEGNYWHLQPDGKTFTYSFNTLNYPSQLQVSVEVNAYDKAGNKAQGATASYYLDNRPPIIDLQPPLIQEQTGSGTNAVCSALFDPLGDSPDDLAVIPSVRYFRALLWDEGNLVDGQGVSFFSDIDTNVGVRLYLQQDATKPLLKNKHNTAGAQCNEIADETLPFVNLVPIAPTGSAFFSASAPAVPNCKKGGETAPSLLCNSNSSLSRVIQHETATSGTSAAVVYALQGDNGALCTGGQLDITTKVSKDGWVCAAVVAQDRIGNRTVSAPIRLCLDAADGAGTGYQGSPSCVSGLNPPTCIAAAAPCVPPPHFGKTLLRRP